jgi:hypothetical protein
MDYLQDYLHRLRVSADHLANGAAASPLFQLPRHLRVLIYDFLFCSYPPPTHHFHHPHAPHQYLLPKSSPQLDPLLVCRQFYEEAQVQAWKSITFNLNWSRHSSCLRALGDLEPRLYASIRHVALTTPPSALYDRLQPLRYHFDHMRQPVLVLETVTIILEPPDYKQTSREKRIQEMNMVLDAVWFYKNVEKVVIENVLHREALKDHPANFGRWTCLDEEEPELDIVRWRFELAEFHNYG